MGNTRDYTFNFESSKTPKYIFDTLLDVQLWWSGLYSESIEGNTGKLNEVFTFRAGDGAHYSKQKLVEVIADQKIVWLVTDSNLSFLQKPNEWTGTKICFEINDQGAKTQVHFSHLGLVPQFECFNGCAGAWTQYLENLAEKLR